MDIGVVIILVLILSLGFTIIYFYVKEFIKKKQRKKIVDCAWQFYCYLNGTGEFPENLSNEKKRFKR